MFTCVFHIIFYILYSVCICMHTSLWIEAVTCISVHFNFALLSFILFLGCVYSRQGSVWLPYDKLYRCNRRRRIFGHVWSWHLCLTDCWMHSGHLPQQVCLLHTGKNYVMQHNSRALTAVLITFSSPLRQNHGTSVTLWANYEIRKQQANIFQYEVLNLI